MKLIKYLIKSILIGIGTIIIVNLVGQFFNFQIPINFLSISLIGFFHLPGFLILLLILIL